MNEHENVASGKLYLNRNRRSIVFPGALGARLLRGTTKVVNRAGTGDCLLIDLHHNVFAVADSPERSTTASREFLVRFAERLFKEPLLTPTAPYPVENWSKLQQELIAATEELLAATNYFATSTFSCLILTPTTAGIKGLVFQCGDSLILKFDLHTRQVEEITEANCWMIGRTQKVGQVLSLDVEDYHRFLLASDGLFPLCGGRDSTFPHKFLELISPERIDRLPDRIVKVNQSGHLSDDVALIALDPCRLPLSGPRLIKGGTDLRHESHREKELAQNSLPDVFLPLDLPPEEILILPQKA